MITRVSLRTGDRDYEQCRKLLLSVMVTAIQIPTKLVTTLPSTHHGCFQDFYLLVFEILVGSGVYLSCSTN
jgi:hypothetical protein